MKHILLAALLVALLLLPAPCGAQQKLIDDIGMDRVAHASVRYLLCDQLKRNGGMNNFWAATTTLAVDALKEWADGRFDSGDFAAMAIDYATGVLAAYRYKRKHPASKRGPSSRAGALGIIRKVSILCVVALAHYLDAAMGTSAAHTVVIWFYIGNEGLSIVENAGKAGAPIPKRLTETLEQLAKEKEEMNK